MENKYWELVQYDGTSTDIPPEHVDTVKRRWDNGQPIHTSGGSISAKDIKSFSPTERSKSTVPLIDSAAQAFNQPIETDINSVKAAWVKKAIPYRIYAKLYSGRPSYRVLENDNNQVTVAFRVPVHLITASHSYCTEEEVKHLTQGQQVE